MFVINHLFAFATTIILFMIVYCVVRVCRSNETYMTKSVQKWLVIIGTVIFVGLQWLAVCLNLSKGLY